MDLVNDAERHAQRPEADGRATAPRPGSVEPADALLAAFLDARDVPCPSCGYNLRGVRQRACPECDEPLELALLGADRALGGWLLAIVSCALACGADLLAAALFVAQYISLGGLVGGAVIRFTLGAIVALGVVCAASLSVLLRHRRDWDRMSTRHRWRAGTAVATTVFAAHAVVGILFLLSV